MSISGTAQASHVDYALHSLGWKAFQDLCVAVSSEVLGRPVQAFLPSKDGGRDGAFVGTWDDAGSVGKSTIQCKFSGKANSTLSLTDLKSELGKVSALAARGLAQDYIIMTNAGVGGSSEAEIAEAFENAGAKRCRIFGRDWLTNEIRSRPRLRMMVPRIYGLGDLSQIIDARAYTQAKRVLSSMGDDLSCFVTTDAHRQSVAALNEHRFVLLLGDPASGKSTIGASLAIGALDDGASGTIKITSPEAFEHHWNPDEPDQFFWIDDAFGATQYQRGLVDGWNSRLPLLRAAVRGGARVLMTSRTYIWKSAQRNLKSSDFPLFENSQVVIDVQGLSPTERAQILYNHIKLGNQPTDLRKKLKRHLPAVAVHQGFLPETARRLGSSFFTAGLKPTRSGVTEFVERPVVFLLDVLRGLDEDAQAAAALIFLHGSGGVPSPVQPSAALDTVLRLTGVTSASVTRALEVMRGSLTLLVEAEDGLRWIFKHPTIADAFAELVSQSPEMVELYIRGAKRERLMEEVVCGDIQLQGASVRVPTLLYGALRERLIEKAYFDGPMMRFLAHRADVPFLKEFVENVPTVFELADDFSAEMLWSSEIVLLANLHAAGLLPEPVRDRAAKRILKITLDDADASAFVDGDVRALLTDEEFTRLELQFEKNIVIRYAQDPISWGNGVWSSDMPGHFRTLRDSLERYSEYKSHDFAQTNAVANAIAQLESHIEELERDDAEDVTPLPTSPPPSTEVVIATIFDDVDE